MDKSIFSITRATYFNSGHISDYFLKHFDIFAVLSFYSHNTKKGEKTRLEIFKKGKLKDRFYFPTPRPNPPAYLVPFYQLYFSMCIVFSFFLLRFRYMIVPQVCVTSFSGWALTANVMKSVSFCKATIFWSWDYFPPAKGTGYYYLLKAFEPVDRLAIKECDYSWYASESNFKKRIEIGQVEDPKDSKHKVVHWGTGGDLKKPVQANYLETGVLRLVYFGSIDFEKGLDLAYESLEDLVKVTEGRFELLVIGGDTPYKEKLKSQVASKYKKYVKYKDFMTLKNFSKYALKSDLGLALYVPEVDDEINYTYYADPAKPRDYLEYGLPMIITKVPSIYKDIKKHNAGLVLEKYDKKSLLEAVKKYMSDPKKYKSGAFKLAKKDRYESYYSKQFDPIIKELSSGRKV